LFVTAYKHPTNTLRSLIYKQLKHIKCWGHTYVDDVGEGWNAACEAYSKLRSHGRREGYTYDLRIRMLEPYQEDVNQYVPYILFVDEWAFPVDERWSLWNVKDALKDCRVLAAFADTHLIGFAAFCPMLNATLGHGSYWYLDNFAVLPAFQGRKIGAGLMLEMLHFINDWGTKYEWDGTIQWRSSSENSDKFYIDFFGREGYELERIGTEDGRPVYSARKPEDCKVATTAQA
jgi:GNAT superfamily N-acetyltransferase